MKKSTIIGITGAIVLIGAVGAGSFYYLNQSDAIDIVEDSVQSAEQENTEATAGNQETQDADKEHSHAHDEQGQPMASLIKADHVYAEVGAQKILGSDLLALAENLPPQAQENANSAIVDAMLNQLVNDALIEQKAKNLKLDQKPDVIDQLAQIEKRIISEAYIRSIVDEQMTEEKLRQKFDEFLFNNPRQPQVRARHILMDSEEEAKDIITQLNNGADFADMAKKHSTGPSGPRGGELGYFTKEMMVPEFADVAFNLDKGAISQTPVKTKFGWHILKIEDKRLQPKPAFEQIKGQLEGQVMDEIIRAALSDLRDNTPVKISLPDHSHNG